MKKNLLLIACLFLLAQSANAFDLVYPKAKRPKIDAPSTFFIGHVKPGESLYINNNRINVHESGAFAHYVKLKPGNNEFHLYSEGKARRILIERPIKGQVSKPAEYISYEEPKTVVIAREGAPIRSTEYQEGINRIAHYQMGMPLKVIGELADMYKVELTKDTYAWVAKCDVMPDSNPYEKVTLKGVKSFETRKNFIYEFELSDVTPYSIEEDEDYNLDLKIYNVNDSENNIATYKITTNQRLMGYDLAYNGKKLVLSIKKEPKLNKKRPLKNVKIVIDAGHGGKERGAISCFRDSEKDFNLSIARYLEHELKQMGATVYMTRSVDKFVSLNDRVNFTKDKDAQIFVSIHANSLPDSLNPQNHSGSSAYYYYKEAKPLSDAILNAVNFELKLNIEGTKQASFAVVRNTSSVSVLVESAYVINPKDLVLLRQSEFRKRYAHAIALGIKNYVWQNKTKISLIKKIRTKCTRIS